MQGVGRKGERAQEMSFAVAQGEGGEAFEFCLTHNICKIAQSRPDASENENGC